MERPRTIDVDVEVGGIDLLLQMRVGDARNSGDTAPQFLGDPEVFDPVIAHRAHVDLRREPEI